MSDRDDNTPARTPSSLQRLALWGIVEAWLAQSSVRALVLVSGPKGLRVTVIDPMQGEAIEDISFTEDPSRAVLRAIERLRDNMKI